MILPTLSARWAALRGIARTVLALTGIPVKVDRRWRTCRAATP